MKVIFTLILLIIFVPTGLILALCRVFEVTGRCADNFGDWLHWKVHKNIARKTYFYKETK